ncbi:MAG TPA: NAD-dependent epimerase/dehydratase family protein [Solirubrobacteraceae bacterium]|nr:NAD-dependent epimerase/dehydratase family protein [Solirubrobacteraceae bacterium]
MSSRRILITGLSTIWGGRLAARLERDPEVETVVGIDTADPRHQLERTEFVRTTPDAAPLARIIRAAAIDTVVETTLVRDGITGSSSRARAIDPAPLRALLEAAGRARVSKVVVKSSAEYYGSGRDAPAFFTEEMAPVRRPRTPDQRELERAERVLRDFETEHPWARVSVLRCATPIGGGLRSPQLALLGLPAVPGILGFDPRWQFVHEDDIVGALAHAVLRPVPGALNVAGDGVLALSEVASLLGKALLPVLPPWGTLFTAGQVRRLGIPVPIALLRELRYGRGLDNRSLKACGYLLHYTSREAVLKLRDQQRLRPLLGSGQPDGYRYDPSVEEFLRRSPSVRAPGRATDPVTGPATDRPTGPATDQATGRGASPAGEARPGAPDSGGENRHAPLTQGELLEVIPSLETTAMRRLREHEAAGPARPAVLAEIDRQLELRGNQNGA